ncbi:MAG: DUF1275 domain-containing protein [Deltaproteobacteria bacterium]|nr:DUF1275 domain-containing protein [Deltaproteobacteria bacterium]
MQISSLVPRRDVLSPKNLACWMGLCFAAGAVNATTLLASQQFVTHLTGVVTRFGIHVASLTLMTDYFAVFACFVLGAMTAVILLDGRRLRGLPSLPWLPLATVSLLLVLAATLGHFEVFGPFGVYDESPGEFALFMLLAFAMGLQNASVGNATGSLVRTTHLTGPATDLGVALAFLLIRDLPAEHLEAAKRTAKLRSAKIVAFALGCGAAALFVPSLGYLGFLVPAAICAIVAVSLFGQLRVPVSPRMLAPD